MTPLIMLIIYKVQLVFRLVSHFYDDTSMWIAPKTVVIGGNCEYYFTHYLILVRSVFILQQENFCATLIINKRLRMNYTPHVISQWKMWHGGYE